MQVLVRGQANLYSIQDENNYDHFFIEKRGDKTFELVYKKKLETDPDGSELLVNKVERDTAHAFKLRLIDSLVEVRIDCRFGNTKIIRAAKLGLGNSGLYLFLRHAQVKAQQLRRRRKLSRFLGALSEGRLS